ncbi:hypothetical protein, partial [Klebsiella pneumoniae]|uniref:hypothetical protein n=1 Tax=Klebsiella pneumoniae TaxID=573 RepID=UPI003A96B28E
KRAYCLKTQPATGETYPKSDLFNKARKNLNDNDTLTFFSAFLRSSTGASDGMFISSPMKITQ